MGTPGRKSTSELTTASAVAVIQRPEALLELTPEQATVWGGCDPVALAGVAATNIEHEDPNL